MTWYGSCTLARWVGGIAENLFGKESFGPMSDNRVEAKPQPVATGIAGLDDILRGGLTPNRLYLVEGTPGSGKTTLALQYLLDGKHHRESGIYVTLAETRSELEAVARSHNWDLSGIRICELV